MAALGTGSTIGILGGGQLGRMLAMAAAKLGLQTHICDSSEEAPAAQVAAAHTAASYEDEKALAAFASACDVVTFEFENIPDASLAALESHVALHPGRESLRVSQDRLTEKTFLQSLGLQTAPFHNVESASALNQARAELGTPTILKTRRLGYDGKGQVRLPALSADQQGAETSQEAWEAVAQAPCVLEGQVAFILELSAIVVRTPEGETVAYDVPVNTHRSGILHTSVVGGAASKHITPSIAQEAVEAAIAVAKALNHVGVLTVEFFLAPDGALIVNEFAPRVHNSGHWTMDACAASQFENHIRAVAGWPLAPTARHSDAVMTNLIGYDVDQAMQLATEPNISVHLYGKKDVREGRKMGHWTKISPRSDAP